MRVEAPTAVREIARRLEESGYEAWAVGGAVRDALLGRAGGDWDLATRAEPNEVRRLFRRTVPIGIEHGTIGVHGRDGVLYEVTTFRRDIETFGRHAVVAFAETIEEDLSRRDFTINAIAWRPATEETRDPFGGLADLRDRRLRTVGTAADRFAEDYLRVLRALRFAGHFRLTIEAATWTALVAAVPRLTELSAERIREELWKVLGKSVRPSASLSLYAAAGALAPLYPELDETVGLEQGDGAPELWLESLLATDAIPASRPLVRLAALLHGIGKPAARIRDLRGGWRFTGHEVQGARKATAVLRRLKASNADTERVTSLVALQTALFSPETSDAGVRFWLRDVGPPLVRDLFRLRFALWRARTSSAGGEGADLLIRWRQAHRVVLERPPLAVRDLAIDGADLKRLGLRPGPEFGRILNGLLERVLQEPALNEPAALLDLVRQDLSA
jgi:tRNA nucleotidyltransferase (CCA-adding enzyme)